MNINIKGRMLGKQYDFNITPDEEMAYFILRLSGKGDITSGRVIKHMRRRFKKDD